MWRCSSCGTGIEDKHAHCWQCGRRKELNWTEQNTTAAPKAVPGFASYEELAHVPSRPMWLFRRGPVQRLAILFGILIVFKIVSAPFLDLWPVYSGGCRRPLAGDYSLAFFPPRSNRRCWHQTQLRMAKNEYTYSCVGNGSDFGNGNHWNANSSVSGTSSLPG